MERYWNIPEGQDQLHGSLLQDTQKPGELKKTERMYYIVFKKDGCGVEEKACRESQGMTAARANLNRAERMQGRVPSSFKYWQTKTPPR